MIARISAWASILSRRDRSTLRIFPLSGSTAWNRRSRPCFAEPPAESPSTIYNSLSSGFRSEQSASFPGSMVSSRTLFLTTKSRALRAASLARAAVRHFSMIRRPTLGCSSRWRVSSSPTTDSTCPLSSALPRRVFRLALELWLGHLDVDYRDESLTHVLAGQIGIVFLQELLSSCVLVENTGEGATEPSKMSAAINGADCVGKGEGRLCKAVVVLDCYFDD